MSTPINPSSMYAGGSSFTIGDATYSVGYQGGTLKSASAALTTGITLSGNTLIVSKAGAVLDGFDLRGYSVEVRADNVTIKNSLFNATGFHTIYQTGGATGLTVEYNTFDGQKANNSNSDLIYSDRGVTTIRNNEFFNLPSDAINTVGGLIERNYFYGAGYQTGAHADAISIHSNLNPIVIRQNYIDYRTPSDAAVPVTNAAIKIAPVFGVVSNVTVDGNVLLGGGYTIYAYNATYAAKNITITNNEIGLGKWGVLYPSSQPENFSYYYNYDFSSGSSFLNIGTMPAGSTPAPAPSPTPQPSPVQETSPAPTSTVFTGTANQDFMYGTAANETFYGLGGIDVIEAGAGNDTLIGGAERDWMTGGDGDDVYVYTAVSDSRPGADCDVIWGFSNGNDKIDVSRIDANTVLSGVQAFKWIGTNAFSGQAGDLRAFFDGTNTIVQGDVNGDKIVDFQIQINGNNALSASSFIFGSNPTTPSPAPTPTPTPTPSPTPTPTPSLPTATMTGTEKQDVMRGTSGADVIYGKGGIDVITAGAGNDIIVGGANRDWLSGQGGNDTFLYTALSDSRPGSDCDVICDWNKGDRIDLRLIDANTAVTGDQAFSWIGSNAFSGKAGELRAYVSGSNTLVMADVNGDRVADLQIQVNGKVALAASDFLL